MKEQRLAWWVFKCLAALLTLGILIVTYSQFRINAQAKSSFIRNEIERLSFLVREIISRNINQTTRSSAEYNALCQQMAVLTKKRVSIITDAGKVLGDSAYGSDFNVDEAMTAMGLSTFFDPVAGKRILTNTLPIITQKSNGEVFLRLSTPLTSKWNMVKIVLQESGIPILSFGCLIILCSVVISQKITASVRDTTAAVQSFQTGNLGYRIPHARFDEFQRLNDSLHAMAKFVDSNRQLLHTQAIQWEAIITNMHEGVLAVDHDHNIIIINNAAREFLGIRKDASVLQRPLLEIFRNSELNTFLVALEDTGHFHESELDFQLRLRPARTFHISGLAIEFQTDKPAGYLLVFSEITQIKKLEKMRQDFVANVSHELKTPITAIKGLIETVTMTVENDPENARRFIGMIERNADRLNDIINDLLHLSRLEYGDPRIQKDFQLQNIRTTIQQALSTLDDQFKTKSITCVKLLEDHSIYANHRLLEQAFSNLINNAIKYSQNGGEITVKVTRDDDNLEIVVQDNGVGIPPEHRERIFERFYRVDKSRDRQTGGTGLGLSIVKHVVQLHNGSVSLSSQVGDGSKFTIRLPIEQNEKNLPKTNGVEQVVA